VAHHTQPIFGGRATIELQKIQAAMMAPQWRSTKVTSAPDLPNTTQGAKVTAKDIQNAILLASIQPATVGSFSDLFLLDG
jgi:hypothetical protein